MTKGLVRANNFSDLADKDEAVVNLGLSAADYAALKGLYTTAGIDFAVIGEIGNSQGNYQAQLDGIGTTLSGVVLSGYVNRSGDTIFGTWTHSGIINISSGLPSGYPASTDSLFSLSIESGEAVIVASGLIASGLSYNGVRQSSSTVQRAFPPSGFSPLHLIPLQVGGQSFFAEAGESPSFHIDPVGRGHALDLVTGNLLGTYNSASPALAVGPDGVLFQPAANAPVIEYDPATLQCLGARIWGAVTNRALRSEEFDSAAWVRLAGISSVSQNSTIAPNGQLVADSIIETSGVNETHTLQQTGITITSGVAVTQSCFMKAEGRAFGIMAFSPNVNFNNQVTQAFFNLQTGAVSNVANCTAAIQAFPNGWYRCSITATPTASTTNALLILRPGDVAGFSSYVGDGRTAISLFGAQYQDGPLGPYVPTTTTAASSTADAWSITGADFSRIYNPNETTIYLDALGFASSGRIYFDDGVGISERFDLRFNNSNWGMFSIGGGVGDGSAFSGNSNPTARIAGTIAANGLAVSVNGAAVVTDASITMPQNISQMWIGSFRGSSAFANGYIRKLAIFRSRRPNANLQAMTS